MAVDFDRLNRETHDYNCNNVNRFNPSTPKYGTSEYWLNYFNNQTYKQNNGEYPQRPF
jgi:hypothetical protein